MAPNDVPTLLAAVRRRLWRQRFVAATRVALWSTTALLLLALALHLFLRPVPPALLLAVVAAPWLLTFARALAQRPALADCAWWADRHLDGQSAFSTLLELQQHRPPAGADAGALHRLRGWAASRAPHSMQLLAERREPAVLPRPMLALLVCAAFAASVQVLWPAIPPRSAASATVSPPGAGQPLAPATEAAAHAGPSTSGPTAAAEAPPAAAPAEPAQQRHAHRAGERDPAGDAAPTFDPLSVNRAPSAAADAAAAAVAMAPRADAAGEAAEGRGGSQQQAGDAIDERAAPGRSRALPGPVATPRSPFGEAGGGQQADTAEGATYDEDRHRIGAAGASWVRDVPAAAPPAAGGAAQLTQSETDYVRAWMRANARSR